MSWQIILIVSVWLGKSQKLHIYSTPAINSLVVGCDLEIGYVLQIVLVGCTAFGYHSLLRLPTVSLKR